MHFLKGLRAKSSRKGPHEAFQPPPEPSYPVVKGYVSKLSDSLLRKILITVCPHSGDDRYTSSEDSMQYSECPSCDLQDLVHCALVNQRWRNIVRILLFQNVRIDAIHFCGRPPAAVNKKRTSFIASDQYADTASQRLSLFVNTVRRDQDLALLVHTLKIPCMTRETALADIARAISAPLTNIRFLDLPEGIYRDDPSTAMLKAELEANCPELRRWKVSAGGETYVARFERGLWPHLEELTLSEGLAVDSHTIARMIGRLPKISKVTFVKLPNIDDKLFMGSMPLPALRELCVRDISRVTGGGLLSYTSHVTQTLRALELTETGVEMSQLHQILASCTCLEAMRIRQTLDETVRLTDVPPLMSKSLRTLNFEVSASFTSPSGLQSSTKPCYEYLAHSMMQGHLPFLSQLFVLTTRMASLLLKRLSRQNGTEQLLWLGGRLRLYTKSDSDLEWDMTIIEPYSDFASARRSTRPVSYYESNSPNLSGSANRGKDVMVGHGFGGFLDVPNHDSLLKQNSKHRDAQAGDGWWAS